MEWEFYIVTYISIQFNNLFVQHKGKNGRYTCQNIDKKL